jgi:hypothetical protein
MDENASTSTPRKAKVDWVWTLSGQCAGYWDGHDLWGCDGHHLGRRRGLEIYAPNGEYLGEVMEAKRLARKKEKIALRAASFQAFPSRKLREAPPQREPLPLPPSFDEFPVKGLGTWGD